GRRISVSTRATFLPPWASTAAMFTETVDLPSLGWQLVTAIAFDSREVVDKRIDVRNARNDSENGERGSRSSSGPTTHSSSEPLLFQWLCGIMARDGSPSISWISCAS